MKYSLSAILKPIKSKACDVEWKQMSIIPLNIDYQKALVWSKTTISSTVHSIEFEGPYQSQQAYLLI